MNKENWINEVLNSTKGMTTVAPSDDLFSKIEKKILQRKKTVSKKTVWLAAASVIALIAINITGLRSSKNNDTSLEKTVVSTLITNNQLY